MADEYNRGVGPNWWELQPLSSPGTPSAAAATTTSSALASCSGGGYCGGWLQSGLVGGDSTNVVDMRVDACRRDTSSAADDIPPTASSTMNYQNSCSHQLQMMGLGLSSPPNSTDWNNQQGLLSRRGSSTSAAGGEMGNNLRSMLQAAAEQENMGPTSTSTTFLFGNSQWKPTTIISSLSENKPIFLGGSGGQGGEDHHEGSCVDDFKQAVTVPRGFSLDQFSHTSSTDDSTVTCHTHHHQQGYNNNTLADSPSSSLQGLFIGSHHHQHQQQQTANSTLYRAYDHHHQHEPAAAPVESYGGHHDQNSMMMGDTGVSSSNWSTHKVVPHEFLRQAAMAADQSSSKPQNQLLHFTNDGPFWNSSSINIAGGGGVGGGGGGGGEDVRLPAASGFFPSLMMQAQLASSTLPPPPPPPPTFDDDKPPKLSATEARDAIGSNSHKKSAGAARTTTATASTKRSRNEASSTMPPFKVRKEKMGDRITALQQLVSPFGKTDTASVLSEAIEYIKFLHEQVSLLSTPYLKSGSSLQHQQQSLDKSKDPEGGARQLDLRSRGLCLVPVSSTFPVAHETSVDFWTPSFGGTFR